MIVDDHSNDRGIDSKYQSLSSELIVSSKRNSKRVQ